MMKVDNDNNNAIKGALGFQMMSEVFKNAVGGDSDTFQLVMESLLKASQDGSFNFSGLGLDDSDLSKLGYGENTPLKAAYSAIKSDIKTGNVSIDEAVSKASKKYNVDKNLILAVIKQESAFDPTSVSSAGAEGLMQLMPDTASEFGVSNPFDVDQNVDGGTKYLSELLDMYGNCKELALSAYNAGPGSVSARGVESKDEIYKMPAETRDYVSKVMKYYGK